MKLIKDGKIFNLSTATQIAISTKFTNYGTRQFRIYKSIKGAFFETETCNYICKVSGKIAEEYHRPEEQIKKIHSVERVREIYEYTMNGGVYQNGHYDWSKFQYQFNVEYEDLFELIEG